MCNNRPQNKRQDALCGLMMPNRAKRNQGFTLLELLVVMAIMVLGFAAISISLSSGNETTELKVATRDMVSALRYARGLSLMSRKESAFTIDCNETSYTVGDKVFEIPQNISIKTDSINATHSFRFYPDGSSSGGFIRLDRGKKAWRIDISWLTGKAGLVEVDINQPERRGSVCRE